MSYSSIMAPLGNDDPLVVSWMEYSKTAEYANSVKWCSTQEYAEGSMWAAFSAGWDAAMESMNRSKKGADE